MTSQIFLARQPIYDRNLRLYGYELLFRAGATSQSNVTNADAATGEVMTNAIMDIGLDRLVGSSPAFINMTRPFLTGALPNPLPKERVVLELLEDLALDPELTTAVQGLAQTGYRIALDDFTYRPEVEPLLQVADFVKLDVQALDLAQLQAQLERVRTHKVGLLAEKVETYDQLRSCQDMGFSYFQGFFLSRPDIVTGKRPGANRLVLLQLLAKLQDPKAEVGELQGLIAQDTRLAYRLLRYINSAFFALPNPIKSLKHAIALLGIDAVRKLASLMLLTELADEKPRELLSVGLIRGKMCELVGSAQANAPTDDLFTVGLFSTLDALLDTPLQDVVDALPLDDQVKSALLQHAGHLGTTLDTVVNYEQGNWDAVADRYADTCMSAYTQSIEWANELCQTVYG